jgi:hypothetical protein
MSEACAALAPCLDVTLKAVGKLGLEVAVGANDWLTISDGDLMKRILPYHCNSDGNRKAQQKIPSLTILASSDGQPLGRAAIWDWEGFYDFQSRGVIVVGGLLACRLAGIVGILFGTPKRASRDLAVPLIDISEFRNWAELQRDARAQEGHPPEVLSRICEVLCASGVEPTGLPIARTNSGWVDLRQIESIVQGLEEVVLVQDASVDLAGRLGRVNLHKGVFAVARGSMSIIQAEQHWLEWPPRGKKERGLGDVEEAIVRSVARSWKCPVEEVIKQSIFRERKEVEIGTIGENPYVNSANILCRPKIG